ncbi:hypothetical protein D5047_11000 [Verminephrobacter eiseniae]|nr:hypothetical protein [Verminephrobacter eiseniae]
MAGVGCAANPARRMYRLTERAIDNLFNAGRMIKHAGHWIPGLGASDSGFAVSERHDGRLPTG